MRKVTPFLLLFVFLAPCAGETLAGYQQRLDIVRDELQRALDFGNIEGAIRSAKQRLGEPAEVTLPSGEQVKVDNSALLEELEMALNGPGKERRARTEGIVDRLDSLAGAAALLHQSEKAEALGPSPQQATATLKSVLARREFVQGAAERGWSRLMRLLVRLVTRILEAAGKAANAVAWVFLVVGAAGLAAMTVFLALRIARTFGDKGFDRPKERPSAPPKESPTTKDEALRRADEAAGKGDYREALRSLYQALLLLLGERGLIKYEKGMTNWEYVRLLRGASSEVAEGFAASTVLFERSWYGWMAATRLHYAALMDRFEAARGSQPGGRANP